MTLMEHLSKDDRVLQNSGTMTRGLLYLFIGEKKTSYNGMDEVSERGPGAERGGTYRDMINVHTPYYLMLFYFNALLTTLLRSVTYNKYNRVERSRLMPSTPVRQISTSVPEFPSTKASKKKKG
jgi:hypothetical protein